MMVVKSKNNSAFTLVELLAVIVILALIMGISVFAINNVLKKSKVNVKNSSVNSILDAVNVTTLTDKVTLPAEFIIDSDGTISLSTDDSIKVQYDKEKPIGGKIYIDQSGKISAVGIEFKDGYKCTMASGENGCNNENTVRDKIISDQVNHTGTFLYNDPNESERKVFAGTYDDTPNRIMIKENGVETLYRIMSIEADGRIKVIRSNRMAFTPLEYPEDTLGRSTIYAIDFDDLINRKNIENTYCYSSEGASYYGCNAWESVKGLYTNGTLAGTVTKDSIIKKVLENVYLPKLDQNVKEMIVSSAFDTTPLAYIDQYDRLPGINDMYATMNGVNKKFVIGKVGIISARDYLLGSKNSYGTSPTCGENGYMNQTACRENYLYTISPVEMYSQAIWTMNPLYNDSNEVWVIYSGGTLMTRGNTLGNYYDGSVKPVFFLSSKIKLTGTGTTDNPYRID